jgi:hypothetical protein
MPIKSVIEFGAGIYSSKLFMDRNVFPLLESLVSFEDAPNWAHNVWSADPRHALVITQPDGFEMHSAKMKADFVFVDSGPGSDRVKLVQHGLKLAPVVAVHDYLEQNLMCLGTKYMRGFNSTIQTVFVSNTVDLDDLRI